MVPHNKHLSCDNQQMSHPIIYVLFSLSAVWFPLAMGIPVMDFLSWWLMVALRLTVAAITLRSRLVGHSRSQSILPLSVP